MDSLLAAQIRDALLAPQTFKYSEDWINERSYIKLEKLILALDRKEDLVEARVF